MGMAAIQGELDEINEKYKDNANERAKATMQLYKDRNIRPLAGFVAILVQIPIFIALYFAFFREGLPNIDTALLYSFVHAPAAVNLQFLGFLNLLNKHNIVLSIIVALLQYFVVRLTITRSNSATTKPLSPEKAQAQKVQQGLMLYAMPTLYAVIAYSLPAAAGLYFGISNLISLGQEVLIRRQLKDKTV
jgi:YidC/Oxa1 family membrane protein insertase